MDHSYSRSIIESDTNMDQLQSDCTQTQANIDQAGRGQHSPVEAKMDRATYL